MIDWSKLFRALTGQPEPVTEPLLPAGTVTMEQMAIILNDKLNSINSPADIFLPDGNMKIYRKGQVKDFHGLAEVASIKYVTESHDCDDFAAELFGKFSGLIWTDVHALDWFIDETMTFYFIEPQTGTLSQNLAGWQGSQIRFLIGR